MTATTLHAQDPAPAAAAPEAELSAGWHLRMIGQLARKTLVGAFIGDAFMAGILLRQGFSWPPVVWLTVSTAAKVARALHVRHLVSRGIVPVRELVPTLAAWFLLVGVTQSGGLVLARMADDREGLMVITMVMMAMAGAGVGTSAGILPAFAAWALPFAAALGWAWLSQPLLQDQLFGVLILLLPLMLTMYARDYSRVLERQQRLLDSLRIERDRAESAVAAKRQFFAAASHDLRQPLGVLRWYGDAVLAYARQLGHEPLLAAGEGIGRAVDHAEPLVRRYLEIAQFEAGAVKPDIRALPLARLLQEVVDAHRPSADHAGLQMHLRLPDRSAEAWVRSDEAMLRSILDNLVGNAVKFTPSGHIAVDLQLAHDGGALARWTVRVQDTGIGLSAEAQRHVFDDFYQVANVERSRSIGVGLGLAIARRQMQLLNIACRLDSREGEGACFEIDLPAADAATANAAEQATDPAPTSTLPLRPLQVLIIDDEPDVRLALACMLSSAGWPTRTASGAADALGILETGFKPDAMVLDYRLQAGVTGQDVRTELAAAGCRVPAVFVTGDTAPARLQEMADTGVPVFHKPVQGPLLMTELARLTTGAEVA